MSDGKRNPKVRIYILSTLIALIFALGGFFIIRSLISDDGSKRDRQIHMVTLMKPPPPPEIEEEPPPEPEIEEKILEPEPDEANEDTLNDAEELTDPGENLGLDTDGVAGSDPFGLIAKKGGMALIGGDMGNSALLKKYAWYTQMIQERIRENLQRELEKDGGIPDGNLEAVVRIVLDKMGRITSFMIVGSSGSHKMDNAINIALKQIDIETAPPDDMPRSLKIKVSSKG